MHFDVDIYLLVISATALTSRLQGLSHPNAVVFDEVYYGQFVNLYVNGVFFFDDSGPPLGHMLLALGEYTSNVPVWHMRVIPAVAGSLVIPLAYLILLELGYSHMTACLAAVLLLLDNALLTQSRFMLMESMLICFSFLAIVAFLKFRNTQKTRPFSRAWWAWLLLCGMAMSAAVGIKYVGLFTCFLLMIFGATETWGIIGDRSLSNLRITCHILAQLLGMVVWPAVLYLSMFCLHFNLLWHAGPHDHMMTSAFQASLEVHIANHVFCFFHLVSPKD
uniref:ArnT-like N-terminal domain-containing protein n=1 Tax=Eptatretus burgeri TaxID=7764 RepID=A0A8C4N6F7_EPTBU